MLTPAGLIVLVILVALLATFVYLDDNDHTGYGW